MVAQDADRVAEELANAAEDHAERHGENYWLTVLYRALADHDTSCDGGFDVLKALH